MKAFKINWDLLGIGTSIACAIHCAFLPLILVSLPLFGINIIHNPYFEFFMIALAFAIGTYSLFHAYRKHHGRLLPVLLFTLGMALLFAKQYWHDYELFILPFAVIAIIMAHSINWRAQQDSPKKTQEARQVYS